MGASTAKACIVLLLVALAMVLAACEDPDEEIVISSTAPNCSTGTATADISSDAPAWIEENFTCVEVAMDGDDIILKTRDLPPYPSYYYGAGHTLFDSTLPTDTTNTNRISAQDYTFTLTSTPTIATTSTPSGLGEVGVAVDGTIIFNNQTTPPDTLADEAATLDANTGHPNEEGIYHYHVEMAQLVTTGDDMVGIALDGFPIYGRYEQGETSAVFTGGPETEPTDGINWHEHATTEFPGGVPHYHIVEGYEETGTREPNMGITVELRYMVGSKMGGSKGRVARQ